MSGATERAGERTRTDAAVTVVVGVVFACAYCAGQGAKSVPGEPLATRVLWSVPAALVSMVVAHTAFALIGGLLLADRRRGIAYGSVVVWSMALAGWCAFPHETLGPPHRFDAPDVPVSASPATDESFGVCGCFGGRCDLRHLGADLAVPVGTPVRAVAPGRVLYVAGPDQAAGWGDGNYALFVRHDDEQLGHFVAVYGHIATELRVGSVVGGGDVLGKVATYEEHVANGETLVYSAHLHFGVHPGTEMPSGPAGFAPDAYCDQEATLGYVAPLAFVQRRRDAGGR